MNSSGGASAHVYRFEVLVVRARADGNVIYEANDPLTSSTVQLYEWSPPPGEWAEAAAALEEVGPQLGETEAFSSGSRLYLAARPGTARPALEILRRHQLFGGSWPGVIEEPSRPRPAPAATRPEPGPAAAPAPPLAPPDPPVRPARPVDAARGGRAPMWIAIAGLVLVAAVLAVYATRVTIERKRAAAEAETKANELRSIQEAAAEAARKAAETLAEANAARKKAIEHYAGTTGRVDLKQADTLFRQADASGDPMARMWLARSYQVGRLGFEKEPNASVALLNGGILDRVRALADQGEAEALFLLGSAYQDGLGLTIDLQQARPLYVKACDGGFLLACNNLAGLPGDRDNTIRLYRRACDGGVLVACNNLALVQLDGKPDTALDGVIAGLFDKACKGAFVAACASLGSMYESGRGVPEDAGRAAGFYRQGCDAQNWAGCTGLARLYAAGRGVPEDDAQALTLYQRSCDGRWGAACLLLGNAHLNGDGIPKSATRALEWFKKGCELQSAGACNNLGILEEREDVGAQNYAAAATLYEKACDLGSSIGCANLGLAYENGRGVPADRLKAADLFRRSCDAGNQTGCTGVTRLRQ